MAGLGASAEINYQHDKEEEDYMGDLSHFIPPEPSNPPKLCKKVANEKPSSILPYKKSKNLSWQEQRKIERERKQQQEDELTIANIENPIPQNNIGFKMLKQMGYTPGSALGKDGSGITEPIGVDIRRTRAGVGLEDPHKEKRKREEMEAWIDRKKQEALMTDFSSRQKSLCPSRRILQSKKKSKKLSRRSLRKLERKRNQQQEDELTIDIMENRFTKYEIRFKMLEEMDYTPDLALGKDGFGIAEPIRVNILRSRISVGREEPHKEKRTREEMESWRDSKNQEALMADFGSRQKSLWHSRRIVLNFHKAKAALDQLENKEIESPKKSEDGEGVEEKDEEEEEEEITKEAALDQLENKEIESPKKSEDGEGVEDDEEEEEEEITEGAALDQLENKEIESPKKSEDGEGVEEEDVEEEEITEEDLQDILTKLRDEHRYCLFCGFQYDTSESLLFNCPGPNEDDH